MAWNQVASAGTLEKVAAALTANGMKTVIVANGEEAKHKVKELIPTGAEVMTMTSITLETLGLEKELNESSSYDSVKRKLSSMNRETQNDEMQKLGAAPVYAIGSVHAVTEDGKVLVASNTGSQLPAYTYGSQRVIWVIGAQKVTKNLDEGIKRIYEHVLPLESERAQKAYGSPGSNVSKLVIFNKEVKPDRITIILVQEALGF